MAGIFICYRREDTSGWAGRLCADLKAGLRGVTVFMDIDAIPPGVRFDEYIAQAVGSCDVLIALIGPRWLAAVDKAGRRRLEDPGDFAHLEIATALNRNIRVIPALVGGAEVPVAEDLPAALKPLARRQCYELADHRWAADCEQLIRALKPIVQTRRPAAGRLLFGLGLVLLVALAGIGVKVWLDRRAEEVRQRAAEVARAEEAVRKEEAAKAERLRKDEADRAAETVRQQEQAQKEAEARRLDEAKQAEAHKQEDERRAAAPKIQLSTSELDFGSQTVGADPKQYKGRRVLITNLTDAPLTLKYGLAGANPREFRLLSSDCDTSLRGGMTLTRSCFVGFSFAPAATGNRSAVLSVEPLSQGSVVAYRVSLSGTGVAGTPVARADYSRVLRSDKSDDTVRILSISPSPGTRFKSGQTVVFTFRLRYNLQSRKSASLAVVIWQSDSKNRDGCSESAAGQWIDANKVGVGWGERDVTVDVTWHGGESKGTRQASGFLAPTFSLWEADSREVLARFPVVAEACFPFSP